MNLIGLLPKSKYGPLDEMRAIENSMLLAKGCLRPMPVLFGNRPVAQVGWDAKTNSVWCSPFNGSDSIIADITAATPQAFDIWYQKSLIGFTPTSKVWYDLWPLAGDPDAGLYPGSAATAYVASPTVDPGFASLGPAPSAGQNKNITGVDFTNDGTAGNMFIIYDRVLVYNACAVNGALVSMTNTVSATRYAGLGVQMFVTYQVVLSGTPNLSAVSYVNQAGTTHAMPNLVAFAGDNTTPSKIRAAGVATAATTTSPFLPLAVGDLGVQKINSYTTSSSVTGSICFVLARPLVISNSPVAGSTIQQDFIRATPNLSQLYSDTCLSVLINMNGTTGNDCAINLNVAWG